jgi:RIO kinase 1
MITDHDTEQLENLKDDLGYAPRIRHAQKAHRVKAVLARHSAPALDAVLAQQSDDRGNLDFTYKASRYERFWLGESLGMLYEQHWFDDVLRVIKGGKEASVYLCKANATSAVDLMAAKVYRPRQFRALKKDHIYREGRILLDEDGNALGDDRRVHHAVAKKTTFGKEVLTTSWIEHEFSALQMLSAAGADVPTPFTRGHNAILMSYVGNEDLPASPLSEVELCTSEARSLFQRVVHNIELMLANQIIHADLSAYNILYWDGDITIIDFPQVMQPEQSANTLRIFQRDVTRVCDYFAAQGVRSDARRLAEKLWTAYHHNLYPEMDPLYLDPERKEDRQAWEKQKK